MGYVKFSDTEAIDPEVIEALALLLGLVVPSTETPILADAVRGQFASIVPLDALDLTDIMPALEFDPRWEEQHG